LKFLIFLSEGLFDLRLFLGKSSSFFLSLSEFFLKSRSLFCIFWL
jgi:hypothetical protein